MWGFIFSPAIATFIAIRLLGTFFVVLSRGLFGVWVRLELGFFGFLPILNGKTVGENEAAVKYFIVQRVGSGVLLVRFLFVSSDFLCNYFGYVLGGVNEFLLLLGVIFKLGVFPFHFWFPSVIRISSWLRCFWLRVIQKVGPFWVVSRLGLDVYYIRGFIFLLVITSLVGSFGGIAQVQFRPLLAYSSLGQTGWMGLVAILDLGLFIIYMGLYIILLGALLCVLHEINSYRVDNLPGWVSNKGLFF